MFTGIVQAVGTVLDLTEGVLRLKAPNTFAPDGFAIGESISVNGCCLTVVPGDEDELQFDLSPETFHRTSLGDVHEGDLVNLERAMLATARFGGHFVQGHVDATGSIVSMTPEENSTIVRYQVPAEYDRYLVDKGSITIDGISLTVVEPKDGVFDTWIIPHTMSETNLSRRFPGDRVNLEFDVIARYIEKLTGAYRV